MSLWISLSPWSWDQGTAKETKRQGQKAKESKEEKDDKFSGISGNKRDKNTGKESLIKVVLNIN